MKPELLYSKEAEAAVLGSMLAQPHEVIPQASSSLRREDFFVPAHKELFRVMVSMFDKMQAVDAMTVHHQLEVEKLDKTIGSPGILAELLTGFASHLNVASYIQIVKEFSLRQQIISACSTITRDAMETDSASSCLDKAETLFGTIGRFGTKNRMLTMKEYCDGYRRRREAIQIGEVTPRIPTGIHAIDGVNGGLPVPGYGIIAGEMGGGKSDLMLQIARYHAKELGRGVGIFSLEMTPEELLERMISEYAQINSRRLVGKLHQREEEAEEWALRELEKWNIHIDPTPGIGPDEMRRGTRRMVDAGCGLIVLDNAQLTKGSNNRQERHLQLTEVSSVLAELSKEHNVTFIILVQVKQESLNKYKDGKKVLLGRYDLADCAAFQRDGRFILVINSVDGEHSDKATPIIINIAKFNAGKEGPQDAMYNKEEHRMW